LSNIVTGPIGLIKMTYDGSLPQLAKLGLDLIKHPQQIPAFAQTIYDKDWKPLVERGEYARLAGHAVGNLGILFAGSFFGAKSLRALSRVKRAEEATEVGNAAEFVTAAKVAEVEKAVELETLNVTLKSKSYAVPKNVQITVDRSWINQLLEEGIMTPAYAQRLDEFLAFA
jgi:hypothetical protein